MTTDRFGFVRRSAVANIGDGPVEVELLDGIQNLMPHGLTRRFQMEYSTLADGYKENELEPATGLGLFRLSSIPADRPEPNEALRATTVWSEGIEAAHRLLCSAQVDRFRQGLRGGRRNADPRPARCLFRQRPAGAPCRRPQRVEHGRGRSIRTPRASLQLSLFSKAAATCARNWTKTSRAVPENLIRIVAEADGLQVTGDDLNSWRHFSNALFNTMRGGIPDHGYEISRADFKAFIAQANHAVVARHAAFLDALPETVLHSSFAGTRARAAGPGSRAPGARISAADFQPPARRPQPPLEHLLHRSEGRAR